METKFNDMYEKYHKRVTNFVAYQYGQDENDVEDITQEIWMRVWEKMLAGTNHENEKLMLWRVTRDKMGEFFRRRGGGVDPLQMGESSPYRDKLQMCGNKDYLRNLKAGWEERVCKGDSQLLRTITDVFGEADVPGMGDPTGNECDDWADLDGTDLETPKDAGYGPAERKTDGDVQ